METGRSASTQTMEESGKILKIKKLEKIASLPTRATSGSVGLDIKSSEDMIIKANSVASVKTGISAIAPEGCYLRIAPRSGLSLRDWIQVGAGVIDRDYCGEIKVVLINLKDSDFSIKTGDRIAQIICERIEIPMVEEVAEIEWTERGKSGFGSTGSR